MFDEVLLTSWLLDSRAVNSLEPIAREVPRVRIEIRGRRVVMHALMTPMQGSAVDHIAEAVKFPKALSSHD